MRFEQGPMPAPWRPVGEYNRFSSRIVFEHPETGEHVEVPSVWYNQPVSARVGAMHFYADRADENARRMDASQDAWAPMRAAEFRANAARLRALADEMERTGKVLA